MATSVIRRLGYFCFSFGCFDFMNSKYGESGPLGSKSLYCRERGEGDRLSIAQKIDLNLQ